MDSGGCGICPVLSVSGKEALMMKICVIYDLEGVAGVVDHRLQCWFEGEYYQQARRLATLEVVEEIAGNEVAFQEDFLQASVDEISHCGELLGYLRRDLMTTVEPLPAEAMDWDPPYQHFASYAWWRTIRQIVKHVALTEVAYYLPSVGWQVRLDLQALQRADWQEQLRQSREETYRFLDELRASSDRVRLRNGDETWTVRKVLRRLVWHERLHLKSIRRVVADYERSR